MVFACLALALSAGWVNIETPNLSTQYVPISKRYPGLDFPASESLVTVELVYDAACTFINTQAEAASSSTRRFGKW